MRFVGEIIKKKRLAKKIALSEIANDLKISINTLEDSAINKLRKVQNEPTELEDLEADQDDDFNKIYKGEISKSGAAILPSKRVRKIPEKIIAKNVSDKIEKEISSEKESKEEDSALNENKTE